MLIKAAQSCLIVVDAQDRLRRACAGHARVVRNIATLMKAAARLDVPILVSEHDPKGIGPTARALRDLAPAGATFEKIHFSCAQEAEFVRRFNPLKKKQVVLAGIETHVCVLQTGMDLLGRGTRVFLVADAVSSRTAASRDAAGERLRQTGAEIVTTEMVVFEWLRRGDTPEFKSMLELVK